MAEGYVTRMALDKDDQVIGYEFVSLGKMTDFIKKRATTRILLMKKRWASTDALMRRPVISTPVKSKEERKIWHCLRAMKDALTRSTAF